MLAPQGALLTVQPIVGADDMSAHYGSSPLTDDIVIYEHSISQGCVMLISLLRVRSCADVVVAATPLLQPAGKPHMALLATDSVDSR